MQVGKISTQGNAGLNVFRINQNFQNEKAQTYQERKRANDGTGQDRATISPQGRRTNMLQSLMEQRDRIQEQRQKLVSEAMASGKDMKAIEVQLDTFEQQLGNIDTQVQQLMAAQLEQQTEQAERTEQPEKETEPKTKDEARSEAVIQLSALATGIETAKAVSRVQSTLKGQAAVMRSEAKLQDVWIDQKESAKRITGGDGYDGVLKSLKKEGKGKKEAADLLEQDAARVAGMVAEQLGDVRQGLAENTEAMATAHEDPATDATSQQSDPAQPKPPQE